ncbi:MAG: GGDEF domain-containing protein [Paracoccaceae bacterium]
MMSSLLSRHETRHAKVCILNDGHDPDLPAMAFDFGASDLVSSAQSLDEIALRLARLVRRKRAEDRSRASVKDKLRLAMIDPLTGIANRRAGLAQLAQIAERAQVSGRDFALMVLDLDRFKTINDRFGHAAGDAVLVEVAQRLTLCLRSGDLIARIGGEEFLICLPDVGLAEGTCIAERLCEQIEARPILVEGRESLGVTISIGLALGRGDGSQTAEDLVGELFRRADTALLAAKGSGRNKVTISRSAA